MNQTISLLLKQVSLRTSDFSERHPLRFPVICYFSPLTPIRPHPFPPNSTFSAFPSCQRHLSECTIMDVIVAVGYPVRWSSIQTPKLSLLVPLRAA